VPDDPESGLPDAPRLPQRAAIYITPDGSVTFGALFEGLLPVAAAIAAKSFDRTSGDGDAPCPAPIASRDSDPEA
jgi:hypothetical protein